MRSKASAAAAGKVPVGLELYSVRDELAKDLTGTVRAVAKMGYEVVEFYSPYFSWTPEKAKEVRKLLDDLGVRCRSTHNDAATLTPDEPAEGDRAQSDHRQQVRRSWRAPDASPASTAGKPLAIG